MKNRRLW